MKAIVYNQYGPPDVLKFQEVKTSSPENNEVLVKVHTASINWIGQIEPGQHVLINGAGGGVGTFAIQMAKASGAEVTGVDSTDKLNIIQLLGADHAIDYTQEDFTKS